jgi:chaperone required for assembly of F1-ATPase
MATPPTKTDARPLPKRFYADAKAEAVTAADGAVAFRILLDGRPLRTPAKAELQVPSRALADAAAEEWQAQASHIDPATMPLTRLLNSTIDGVAVRRADVIAEIARYAMNDLVYYRADQPEALARMQAAAWDPVLDWAQKAFAVSLATGTGIAHVAQPQALEVAVTAWLTNRPSIELSALHVITTLTGSALMALAHAQGAMAPAAVWTAAHVDEDFQISKWGWDADAEARRKAREADFLASTRALMLARDGTS